MRGSKSEFRASASLKLPSVYFVTSQTDKDSASWVVSGENETRSTSRQEGIAARE
jgi:hypothetical protein